MEEPSKNVSEDPTNKMLSDDKQVEDIHRSESFIKLGGLLLVIFIIYYGLKGLKVI